MPSKRLAPSVFISQMSHLGIAKCPVLIEVYRYKLFHVEFTQYAALCDRPQKPRY